LVDVDEIPLFRYADQLPPQLWDDLDARPRDEAAQAAQAQWDDRRFTLPLLGRDYLVDPEARSVHEAERPDHRVSFQTGLVLVSTLGRAIDAPVAERMVTPQELPGGSQFFAGVHAVPVSRLEERFGSDPNALLPAAEKLGGGPWEGADAAVFVPGIPRIPLYVLLWGADQEFEARAVVGMDARAHMHLALDGILALTTLLIAKLVR
jgi:hypothetical protein